MFDVNNVKLLDRERQMTDPTFRQRGLPKKTRQQVSEKKTFGQKVISGHKSQNGLDTLT
jgi:hypothetical protein